MKNLLIVCLILSTTLSYAAEKAEKKWYLVHEGKCEESLSFSNLIAEFKESKIAYSLEDVKIENNKPVIVKIHYEIAGKNLVNTTYRTLRHCQAFLAEEKVKAKIENDRYK